MEGRAGQGRGRPGTPEEALLEGREAACLADEDIGDLAHLDADEEHGVAGVLLVQALPERLWARGEQKHPEPRGRGSAVSQAVRAWDREPLTALSLTSEAGVGERTDTNLPGLQDQRMWGLDVLVSQAQMSTPGHVVGQAIAFMMKGGM